MKEICDAVNVTIQQANKASNVPKVSSIIIKEKKSFILLTLRNIFASEILKYHAKVEAALCKIDNQFSILKETRNGTVILYTVSPRPTTTTAWIATKNNNHPIKFRSWNFWEYLHNLASDYTDSHRTIFLSFR